jgi:hypothetical protein
MIFIIVKKHLKSHKNSFMLHYIIDGITMLITHDGREHRYAELFLNNEFPIERAYLHLHEIYAIL